MKNKVFTLLATFALIFSQNTSKAVEIRIPTKTDTCTYDPGHVLNELYAQNINYQIGDIKKVTQAPFYLVIVDSTYLPHIDTFIQLLCNKWQICGNDRTMLLVMANDHLYSRFLITGRSLPMFNDTINNFIATGEIIPTSPAEAVETTLKEIEHHLSSPDFLKFHKEYIEYKAQYGKPQKFSLLNRLPFDPTSPVVIFLVVFIFGLIWAKFSKGSVGYSGGDSDSSDD